MKLILSEGNSVSRGHDMLLFVYKSPKLLIIFNLFFFTLFWHYNTTSHAKPHTLSVLTLEQCVYVSSCSIYVKFNTDIVNFLLLLYMGERGFGVETQRGATETRLIIINRICWLYPFNKYYNMMSNVYNNVTGAGCESSTTGNDDDDDACEKGYGIWEPRCVCTYEEHRK